MAQVVVVCSAALAGCEGSLARQMTARHGPVAVRLVQCEAKQRCDELWARAQIWLARNAKYRLAIANDVVLQTFGPARDDYFDVAFTLTRSRRGASGVEVITVEARCYALFGTCDFDPDSRLAALAAELQAQ